MTEFRYKAFICYSHQNSKSASRLMRQLEAYRVPKHLGGKQRRNTPKNLGKMFRDREELSASDCLDSKLLEAIKQSEFLIVVCSPSAARSGRVNEEITQFIRYRDSRNILCYIVDGEPQFGSVACLDEQDCVAPALGKLYLQSGQIPVAADARDVGDGPAKALLKIVAGLLHVGLDELIQRNAKRHQNRLMGVTAASISFAIFSAILLVRANLAEGEAQRATLDAQLQNERSEDLIQFMLEDLAGIKLEQLGRLDVIDAVIEEVAAHYSRQEDSELGPLGLTRKSIAYQKLGQVYFRRNMHDSADELFDYAYRTTTALTQRYPDSHEAIFAHVRSLYWIGLSNIFRGQYAAAETAWRERVRFGELLLENDDHSEMVWSALGDIHVHLGWALMEMGRPSEAYVEFQKGLNARQENADRFSDNIKWQNNLAGGYYHVQWAQLYLGMNDLASRNAKISNQKYERLTLEDPLDVRARGNYARSLRWLAEAEIANLDYILAENHLRESVKVHEELLDYEPNNTTFQYQACVSSVMLVEVLVAIEKVDAASQAAKAVCSDVSEVLALDHPVVHNRLYGYRHSIANISHKLKAGSTSEAYKDYTAVSQQFDKETREVQQSLRGRRIALSLAVNAAELSRSYAIPNAISNLSNAVVEFDSSSIKQHSTTARLSRLAKRLGTELVENNNSGTVTFK